MFFQRKLEERVLSDFIERHNRAPNEEELVFLMRQGRKNYPLLEQTGFFGPDVRIPQYREASSVQKENQNRKSLLDDMNTINKSLDSLAVELETSFRSFQNNVKQVGASLVGLESRVDNLILLNSRIDAFQYGVEETLQSFEHINLGESTVTLEPGFCTMGRTGHGAIDLAAAKFSTMVTAAKGILHTETSRPLEHLKTADGTFWEELVYTQSRQGRVSLVLEIKLEEPSYITDLKILANAIAVNAHTTYTVFYSLDGQSFAGVEPVEQVLLDGNNIINLGLDGVQKLQLVFSKEASDQITTTGNQFVYIFSLEQIVLGTYSYDNSASKLIAGPYEIVDEFGSPVNFTKATIDACVVEDEDTSVDFSLSNDGITWIPVELEGGQPRVAVFANGSPEGTEVVFDTSLAKDRLLVASSPEVELSGLSEAALNLGIGQAHTDLVPTRAIQIKRNLPAQEELYDVATGWFFDESTNRYSTTVEILNPDGFYVDVGANGIFINNQLYDGLVRIPYGVSVVQIDSANWVELPENLSNASEFLNVDPLYPYNHRYLISGYQYPKHFQGERLYVGVDEYYGALLRYVTPEEFAFIDSFDIGSISIFTIENISGNAYFKVKVDKTDNSWSTERYKATWGVLNSNTNSIYVRAKLSSSSPEHTPILKKFHIRVI